MSKKEEKTLKEKLLQLEETYKHNSSSEILIQINEIKLKLKEPVESENIEQA